MKMLLSTTALVLALGVPVMTAAQTQAPGANPGNMQRDGEMHGFLGQRSQTDLFASELMGHAVHAHRDTAGSNQERAGLMMDANASQTRAMMDRSQLDSMDNIGQVNEIVLSHSGEVRALVIGVGGFLGMGEHDVAVTMEQVSFVSDMEDRDAMYIVVNGNADMFRDAPTYDRTAMTMADDERRMGDSGSDQTRFAAPQMQRDGYDPVVATEVSTEVLMGKSVYDTNDNDVGSVTDMIINDAGEITAVIIDFGGFLGIGTSQASLNFDELTILANEGYADVRIYVDATRDQIQDRPQYQASN